MSERSYLDELFGLPDCVAVVTGASRGIGAAIAEAYARAGAHLVLASRDLERLDSVAVRIRATRRDALAVRADVTRPEDVDSLVVATVRHFGRIDVLVNNAGLASQTAALDLAWQEWDEVLRTNLVGAFLCARAVAKEMVARKRGKIINIVSVRAVKAAPRRAVYAVSKAGLLQLTRALALEWAPFGITVNAIGPGSIHTEMAAALLPTPEAQETFVRTQIPLGRVGEPLDLLGAAIFLASPAADYVTGQVLFVDGGWSVV